MSELICTICHQTDSHEHFLVQHCGHVFCQDCTTRLSHERKCPTCRREWGSRYPFRLYLNFPDSDKSTRIFHDLESMDKDTPAIILESTGSVIKGLVTDLDSPMNHAAATLLLDAALRLEQRVAPIASELGQTRQENETLHQQLKDLNAQLKSKQALTVNLGQLNQTVKEREAMISISRNELVQEKQKRQSEQDTNRRLARSLRKKQEEIETKANEIANLRSEIKDRDKQISLMKSKLRALIKSTRPPKRTVQSPDDSLIVEQLPLSETENSGNITSSHKPASSGCDRPVSLLSLSKRRKTGI